MKYKCLVVDDEKDLADSIAEYFNMFDIPTYSVYDGEACMEFFKENQAELILLDINLGNNSGFELCKKIRQNLDVPIFFISARSSEDDMIIALNIGGDDYICKPFSLGVLCAKAKAVLKRYENNNTAKSELILFGDIEIDLDAKTVRKNGELLKLKYMEYKLLTYLVKNPDRVIDKEELFQNVWEDKFTGDGTLNVHIRHLREKLEKIPINHSLFRLYGAWATYLKRIRYEEKRFNFNCDYLCNSHYIIGISDSWGM
jgi:two-component system response regulator RegX3